jgi:hypothetical protein
MACDAIENLFSPLRSNRVATIPKGSVTMRLFMIVIAAVTTSTALVVPTVGQAQIAGLGKAPVPQLIA